MAARTSPARRLGPEAQPVAAAVVEGVHLLLDDVGVLADRALEELRMLDERHAHLAVSVVRQTARAPAASTRCQYGSWSASRSFIPRMAWSLRSMNQLRVNHQAATAAATPNATATSHGQRARGRVMGARSSAGRKVGSGRSPTSNPAMTSRSGAPTSAA